jgi:hypothetical protein
MAGFAVSINGWIWVSTEALRQRDDEDIGPVLSAVRVERDAVVNETANEPQTMFRRVCEQVEERSLRRGCGNEVKIQVRDWIIEDVILSLVPLVRQSGNQRFDRELLPARRKNRRFSAA